MAERMKSDFLVAVTQLAAERNLSREVVLSAIEAALVSAYRKDSIATGQNISVKLDPATGDISVHVIKTVVDEVAEPQTQISLEEAHRIKPDAEIGESVPTESLPHSAGRIAAQTAKQVVMQRLREAERELVYGEFADKAGEVFGVTVQRIEPRQVIVDLGRAEAILPAAEQSSYERYRLGQKMKVLLQSVERSSRGPELIVSRADSVLLKRLFEMEVPEIYNGAVEIVAIAREPGARSKVAVRSLQDRVDPVGSCVGLRGVRIQNIVNELHGEKIDVVEWNKDPVRYIASALSPSQVLRVEVSPETKSAVAIVPDRQLSLAIGREGQNARLAAKLTGWNVDIKSNVEVEAAPKEAKPPLSVAELVKAAIEALGLSTRTQNILIKATITKIGQVLEITKADLLQIKGFGEKSYAELHERLQALKLLPAAVEPEVAEAIPEAPVEEAVVEPQPEEVEEPAAAEAVEVETSPEAPAEEAPTTEPQVPGEVPPEVLLPPELQPVEEAKAEEEREKEPAVPVLERTASLRDVPENIWSIRKVAASQPGQIRFAEDIVGLKGGVTARRGRRRGDGRRERKRRPRAGRRR